MQDVSAVRVCGVNAVGPVSSASASGAATSSSSPTNETDTCDATSPLKKFVAGGVCGGRIRDLAASASPLRPMSRDGEAAEKPQQTRSVLHKFLDLHSGAGGDGKGLIKRFEPGGGRLFISDKPRALCKKWLDANGLLSGRAVRCLRAGKDDYPTMRSIFYEVRLLKFACACVKQPAHHMHVCMRLGHASMY
jgi:hypothetical protein